MRCCHDKRLRVFRLLCDRFPQYLSLFFFCRFSSKWPSFCISQKYSLFNRNFENKNSRIFLPSFAILFFNKAFIRFFSCRRKVALCQSGRMAHHLHLLAGVNEELKRMETEGHIIKLEKCDEDCFISPIVVTRKKDGSVKLALDSKLLNDQVF